MLTRIFIVSGYPVRGMSIYNGNFRQRPFKCSGEKMVRREEEIMPGERIFTDQELKAMGTRTVDALIAAIEEGRPEDAKKLGRRMYREFEAMHDLYRDWTTALLSFIYRNYGDQALYDSLSEGCRSWVQPLLELYENTPEPGKRARMLATGLRGHLQPLEIEEDDEKFIFRMVPCGSGGRLINEGCYDQPKNFATVSKAQAITYHIKDLPIYCAHCPFQEIIPIELKGYPLFVTIPSQKLGQEPCSILLYKDMRAVPEEYFQRVGKAKSES
jgi:hypothetical protein